MNKYYKKIPGTNGKYWVSKSGKVKAITSRGVKDIVPTLSRHGYFVFSMHIDGKTKGMRVNRAVALTYLPNPKNKPFVNHIDGIKTNNKLANLEWCTEIENSEHANKLGLYGKNNRNPILRNGVKVRRMSLDIMPETMVSIKLKALEMNTIPKHLCQQILEEHFNGKV